jgi:hypothetical protein
VSEARPAGLDVERFVRERRTRWQRFDALLREVERLPDHEMGSARLLELVRLYRQTASDLNEARSGTANPQLLSRLNDLAAASPASCAASSAAARPRPFAASEPP